MDAIQHLPMTARSLRCTCLAVVLLLALGHSGGVQVIGWIGMFASRVQSASVGDALASTFDGKKPCAMCRAAKALAAAEAGEKTPALPDKPGKKTPASSNLHIHLAELCELSLNQSLGWSLVQCLRCDLPFGFATEPPVPPPRRAAGTAIA